MKIGKKVLASCTLLTVVLLATACGKKDNNANASKSNNENSGPTTLRIASMDNPYEPASYTKGLPVMEEIEKKTNTKIEWEVAPSSQYETYTQTVLAAAEDMPDIMASVYGQNPRTLYDNGLIIDLKPLIESVGVNTKKYFEEHPEIEAMVTEPDGKILSLPTVMDGTVNGHGFMIRKDWLDKLGLQVPTTTDELLTVLRAFRDEDPNGNGEKDEIPTTITGTYYTDFSWPYMFGISPGRDFDHDSNDKVVFPPMEDSWKEFLQFMKTMYDEKLMDQMFATRTNEDWRSLVNTDKVGFIQGWVSNAATFNKNDGQEWVPIMVPQAPGHTAFSVASPAIAGKNFITKDCKDPEAAFKFIDFIWSSPEGIMLNNYGIEGLSYEMKDGKPEFTDFVLNNPDGLSVTEVLNSIGALSKLPNFKTDAEAKATSNEMLDKWNEENKKMMREPHPTFEILETAEETQAKADAGWSDIWTYKEEMKNRFIMGKDDIDKDWSSYINQLEKMGIKDVLKVEQEKYDRYLKLQDK